MSRPTVEELLVRLNHEQESIEHADEEITQPNYALWATARKWSVSQTICLLSGLVPFSENIFYNLMREKDPHLMATIAPSYPISPMDLTRLQNVYQIVIKSELIKPKRNDRIIFRLNPGGIIDYSHIRISPGEVIDYFQKLQHPMIVLSEQLLIAVMDGPLLSLDLPECYTSLEIQIPDFKARPLSTPSESALSSDPKIHKEQILNFDLVHLRNDQLTKLIFRSLAAILRKEAMKKDNAKLLNKQITNDTFIKNIIDQIATKVGKSEGYTPETLNDWLKN
jgi:hypothetical protein